MTITHYEASSMSSELIGIIGIGVGVIAVGVGVFAVVVPILVSHSAKLAKLETEIANIKDTIKQAVTEVLIEYGVIAVKEPEKTMELAAVRSDDDSDSD